MTDPISGLSPPARGSPVGTSSNGGSNGPIPARAGEPGRGNETLSNDAGLSPPARGSRWRSRRWLGWRGPIPARAGEPLPSHRVSSHEMAYPRPRGGAGPLGRADTTMQGLSPPARGSPRSPSSSDPMERPIPARAGEPPANGFARISNGAYPRPRGGAHTTLYNPSLLYGLSPPARGSLSRTVSALSVTGPIPARAGEPFGVCLALNAGRAYPRPRGGAGLKPLEIGRKPGLSPPARGSLSPNDLPKYLTGPIPARAGEPLPQRGEIAVRQAYPRPRGGAPHKRPPAPAASGLSPPARGSLTHRRTSIRRIGPIPARAGEPRKSSGPPMLPGAYPRPRGGAGFLGRDAARHRGLSPPARGSRYRAGGGRDDQRPIPARAGEPLYVQIIRSYCVRFSVSFRVGVF